jgi:hypothetical protein
MIPFKPITLESKEIITSYTFPSTFRNCDFSFANMYSWQFLYKSEFAIIDNFLLLRFIIEKEKTVYMFPVGTGNRENIVRLLEEDSFLHGNSFCMMGLTPELLTELDTLFPGQFKWFSERDYFDYIYNREDLVELKGKKYQSKRNHINKFKKEYSYEFVPITKEIVPLCLKLEDEWCRDNNCRDNENLINERISMKYALEHLDELGGIGGALLVDGRIVAFTYGSPITHDTFGIHVEKADTRIDGAYSVINQCFASYIPKQYSYINREEDLGIEGLRKAKLSYHPVMLLEKNVAVKKRTSVSSKNEKYNIRPDKMLLDV